MAEGAGRSDVKIIMFLEHIQRLYHANMVVNSLKFLNFAMEKKERVRNLICAMIMTGLELAHTAF